ncbi:unnamed protein product [Pleuronectes platessa]|uniref:Uncharacterized protein n=1 Tax=Pleuronectes platessa TaxID=8262 RepID=A0A9N7YU31_PLEPL|nr:unnamed protein product [Pleuronectes platessa]
MEEIQALQRNMEVQSGVQQAEPHPLGSPRSGANQQSALDDSQTDAGGGPSSENQSTNVQPAGQRDDTKDVNHRSVAGGRNARCQSAREAPRAPEQINARFNLPEVALGECFPVTPPDQPADSWATAAAVSSISPDSLFIKRYIREDEVPLSDLRSPARSGCGI